MAGLSRIISLPNKAQQLFQRDAQTITPEALESVKAALASSEVEHKAEVRKKAIPRKAAGLAWEDPTLAEWPEKSGCNGSIFLVKVLVLYAARMTTTSTCLCPFSYPYEFGVKNNLVITSNCDPDELELESALYRNWIRRRNTFSYLVNYLNLLLVFARKGVSLLRSPSLDWKKKYENKRDCRGEGVAAGIMRGKGTAGSSGVEGGAPGGLAMTTVYFVGISAMSIWIIVKEFYTSRARAVVRDKRTGKTKGYGFVSFANPTDLAGALKEMNGKYVGNRPIKLRKSNWKERTDVEALERQKVQCCLPNEFSNLKSSCPQKDL
ncbi:RNA-binding protein 42 [Artemisia annua]|uniref:RNA-binding protein 42 n=1 Tax=Artemisia annua TaxID=35608 RepID=A0A2U1PRQ5_ARTAN|nr:RNA-binding protein 42 [Artemisia annua]